VNRRFDMPTATLTFHCPHDLNITTDYRIIQSENNNGLISIGRNGIYNKILDRNISKLGKVHVYLLVPVGTPPDGNSHWISLQFSHVAEAAELN
jgi:hypothetical protein